MPRAIRSAPWLLLAFLAIFASDAPYEELVAAHDEAVRKWDSEYRAGRLDAKSYPGVAFIPKMKALADKLAGTPSALDPLLWLMSNACALDSTGVGESRPIYDWTIAALQKDHFDSPRFLAALPAFKYSAFMTDPAPLASFYEAVLKRAADPETRAEARLGLGFVLSAESILHPAADRVRAIATLKEVALDAPGAKAATAAERILYDLEKLQVGMPAPEITGATPDGAEVKLSHYRGQVVVLDFWGYL